MKFLANTYDAVQFKLKTKFTKVWTSLHVLFQDLLSYTMSYSAIVIRRFLYFTGVVFKNKVFRIPLSDCF